MGSDKLARVCDNQKEGVLGFVISNACILSVSVHNTDGIVTGTDQQSTLSLFVVIGESTALRFGHLEPSVEELLAVIGDLEVGDTWGGGDT